MNILWPVLGLHKGNDQFLGIMTLAGVLARRGHRSEVVDADERAVAEKLRRGDFQILAFSTMSLYCRSYLRLNKKVKETHPGRIFSVFGGPHPTYFPDMIEQDGVDAVCIGEGDAAMLDLVEGLAAGNPITALPNWWVKQDGRIHKNAVRPLIEDLDGLPFPDREIFRTAAPRDTWRTVVMSGRGCPYHCTYCFNNAYKKLYAGCGKLIRRRSVGNVIAELEEIKRHSCYRYIQFVDDLFTLSPKWMSEFAARYRAEIGLPFSCFGRVEHLSPEIVESLREAGCGKVIIGVETGDDRVRREVFKREMADDEIVAAAARIKKAGIKLMTTNILGIPDASLDVDLETLALNIKLKPDYAGVNLLQPYPGTEMYDYARSRGLLAGEMGEGERKEVMVSSVVKFPTEMDRRKAENLEKFFSLAVSFPFLVPLVKRLIGLPQNKLFNFVHALWTNYSIYFKIIPKRIGFRAIREKSPFRLRKVR